MFSDVVPVAHLTGHGDTTASCRPKDVLVGPGGGRHEDETGGVGLRVVGTDVSEVEPLME